MVCPDYDNNYAIASTNSYNLQNCSPNIEDSGKTFAFKIAKLNTTIQLAEAKITSDCETTLPISAMANSGKIKFVLVKPNSNVERIKEIVAKKSNSFSGDITIACLKDTNIIKVVGSNYDDEFKISQKKNTLFQYSTDRMGEKFPFGRRSVCQ